MTGSSNIKPFSKFFQIRWAERLGDPKNPYLIRWTFILFGYSIRIHHWLRSDDRRYFHDHSADLLSIVLRGYYWNVTPIDETKSPTYRLTRKTGLLIFTSLTNKIFRIIDTGCNKKFHFVEGMFNSWQNFVCCWSKSIWFSKDTAKHYLNISSEGAWTLLLEGRKYHKWGFYVPKKRDKDQVVRKMRPLRYFHKYGIIQKDPKYQ